jgi:hypothetical protein
MVSHFIVEAEVVVLIEDSRNKEIAWLVELDAPQLMEIAIV